MVIIPCYQYDLPSEYLFLRYALPFPLFFDLYVGKSASQLGQISLRLSKLLLSEFPSTWSIVNGTGWFIHSAVKHNSHWCVRVRNKYLLIVCGCLPQPFSMLSAVFFNLWFELHCSEQNFLLESLSFLLQYRQLPGLWPCLRLPMLFFFAAHEREQNKPRRCVYVSALLHAMQCFGFLDHSSCNLIETSFCFSADFLAPSINRSLVWVVNGISTMFGITMQLTFVWR